MNNSVYSFLYISTFPPSSKFRSDLFPRFDSIINGYLIEHCGLRPPVSSQIGLVVQSQCSFFKPVAFPAVVDLGLRVNSLGKSSVTYEVGVFEHGHDDVRAVGGFTHVFVRREKGRPAASGMPDDIRHGLRKILKRERANL